MNQEAERSSQAYSCPTELQAAWARPGGGSYGEGAASGLYGKLML